MFRTVALCVLVFPLLVKAQPSDSLIVQTAIANTNKLYDDFIMSNSGIINGFEYREPKIRVGQHPYFGENDWTTGDVRYVGQWYRNASLMFNIASDELIVEHPVNGQEIQLIKIKVAEFTLYNRRFLNIKKDEQAGLPDAGFYEVAHDGPSQVLIRHHKLYEEKIEQTTLVFYYTPKIRFYIIKDGTYVRVFRKRDVLKLFSDKKAEMRAFIRTKKLKISKHYPDSYATVAAYYDSIKGDQ